MTRNISWINEVKNNTKDHYVIWCRDTDNLGEYRDSRTDELVGRNDDDQWVVIKPGANLTVTGCGVPDGGNVGHKAKCRVIARLLSIPEEFRESRRGDPSVGLRLNRVIESEKDHKDKLSHRDHKSLNEIAAIVFPQGNEQNLSLVIDDEGIRLEVREEKESDEWRAYIFGQELGDFAKASLADVAKLALEAAKDALFAA